jgi:adenylyltransferase/sulfurtransferase
MRTISDLNPAFESRYSRQVRLAEIGEEGQKRLAGATVAIVGSGTLGCFLAQNLCRAGVGRLKLVDRDYVELPNLQSQILFDERDAREGYPKALAAARHLREINSTIVVEPFPTELNPWNAVEILADCALILDGTDNFETRFLLNDFSIKYGIPWIYISVLGTMGMAMSIIPRRTACLRCLLPHRPSRQPGLTCETAGLLATAAYSIASWGVTEALKLLLGQEEELDGKLISLDIWRGELRKIGVDRDPDCPTCGRGEFEFLERRNPSMMVVKLCGRETFQITPPSGSRPPLLAQLAKRLERVGRVQFSEEILRLNVPECELTLFNDGRALIKGVRSEEEAKSLYARYIGM